MKKEVSKKDIEKEVLLEGDMSWSDKIKSLLPNFRYNVGGKNALNPFNRAAIRKIDADRKAEIERIMADSARDTLKRLKNEIDRIAPNFPNDTDSRKFIEAVEYIAFVYENVKAATQKNPPEMNVDAANKIINGLSQYVKYFDEVKLQARYSFVNEEIELNDESEVLDELFDTRGKKTRDDFRSRTPQGAARKPETTKTQQLKSNRLPASLAKIGAALGALGWLSKIPTLINMLRTSSSEVVANDILENSNYIKPGEGVTQFLNRTLGDEGVNLSPNSTGADFLDAVTKLGGGDTKLGIESLGAISDNAKNVITQIYQNHSKYDSTSLGQLFTGNWAGTGALKGDLLVTKAGTEIIDYDVLVETLDTFKDTVLSAAVVGIGAILLPLGISMIAAGALVKLARLKGLNDSRHATLETLYQMMREVPSTPNNSSIEDSSPQDPQSNQLVKRERDPQQRRRNPQQLGAGEEIETQKQIGGRPKPLELTGKKRSFSDKLGDYAQDVEAEPVDEKPPVNKPKPEPQGQPQGQRQLGTGQTETKPTGQEQSKTKKPYTQLNNSLTNFFKNLLDIRKQGQQNLQEEFEAVKGLRTPQNKVMLNNFIISVKKLRTLAKFINKLSQTDIKNQELNDLIRKIVQNKSHRTIVYISDLLEKSNTDMVNKFIEIYMQYIKSGKNNFRDIQSIIDSQLNEAKNTRDAVITSNTNRLNLKEFNEYFKFYLKDLYQLFALINKLRNTEQKSTTEEQPLNEKKNKYSKKASEFIGKEISHLKKDKGYPQDRAVAAAIDIAKEKGMKVGAKKKKKKISEEAPTIAPPKPKTPTTKPKPATPYKPKTKTPPKAGNTETAPSKPKTPTTVPTTPKPATPYRPKTKTPPKAGKEQLPNWLSFKSLGLN
jgi:hypothetical protein